MCRLKSIEVETLKTSLNMLSTRNVFIHRYFYIQIYVEDNVHIMFQFLFSMYLERNIFLGSQFR